MMFSPRFRPLATFVVLFGVAALAGCGGSRASLPPASPRSGVPVDAKITINVAPPASAAATSRQQTYFSSKAQSLTVVYYPKGSNSAAGQTTLANLTPTSGQCTTNAQGTVCTIRPNLPPGQYFCNIETYSQSNGHGPVLSIQEGVPLTINGDGSVSTPPWTLWGVPASIVVTPMLTSPLMRQSGNVVNAYTLSAVHYTIAAYDQAGAQLVGPGMPTWQVKSSNTAFAVSQPSAQSPNTFSVAPAGGGPFTTQLSVTATYPQSSANFCFIVGSNCSAPAQTLNALNVTADDWVTFAHDFQRTGYESQRSGISVSTAPKLALRWKVQVPNGGAIYGNPMVYKGNVVVVTGAPAVVYDLSAIDGSVIWQQPLSGAVVKPATLDPNAGTGGLVFVSNRVFGPNNTNLPSQLYALNLRDGSIAWQTTVNGLTRGSEVVANGKIYIPTAGGDPPQCLNAGVQQVDEATGQIGWTWYVNSLTNPNGGGAVWGAIGYDGSHLVFGTGNVCQSSGNGNSPGVVPTADGAVALDLNGHTLWSFVAWAQTGPNATKEDYDTGSAVMIRHAGASTETATFLSKIGYLYTFNTSGLSSSTPGAVLQQQVTANSNYGDGFFASPTTDGSNVVVQTGAYADSSSSSGTRTMMQTASPLVRPDFFTPTGAKRRPRNVSGAHSLLKAFGPSGNLLWSYQMKTFMAGYAAITNGVVVSPGDNAVVALAMNGNGAPIWSYATAGAIDCSPTVVPSGVYIADANGNVYAFTTPYSATATPSSVTTGAAPDVLTDTPL